MSLSLYCRRHGRSTAVEWLRRRIPVRMTTPSASCNSSTPSASSTTSPFSTLASHTRPRLSNSFSSFNSLSLPSRFSSRGHSSSAAVSSLDDTDGPPSKEPFELYRQPGIRNIAVIAHIDHGKTTLVDQLIRATSKEPSKGGDQENSESWLDSGELEAERGITIISKVTRMEYNVGDQRVVINCVDTPGHADFLAASDPILSMVDGVLLLVDAAEGPMTQTKYVLSRALALGLKPLVVLNKVDRSAAAAKVESGETESNILDLFDALGANQEQMEYTTLYASGREGWVTDDPDKALELAGSDVISSDDRQQCGIDLLLNAVVEHIPEPEVRSFLSLEELQRSVEQNSAANSPVVLDDDKFSLAATTVGYDAYLGRLCTGRILSGSVKVGDDVSCLSRRHASIEDEDGDSNQNDIIDKGTGTVAGIFVHKGITRTPLDGNMAYAGDIVTLAGVPDSISIGDTLTSSADPVLEPIETPPRAQLTLAVDFGANDGPLAGKEGSLLASSKIRARLSSEMDNNMNLCAEKSTSDSEKTVVSARGELQIGILVEEMRREGFELIITPPRVLTRTCPDTGDELEPYEEVTVDVDSEYTGTVVSALTGDRKGTLMEILEESTDSKKSRLVFEVPSRALLGFNSEIATATKGNAVVTHMFLEDRPHSGQLGIALEKGKMVSNCDGKATAYALSSLAARGELFVAPGDEVYSGMVIGECVKSGSADMEVNPVRGKEKTNMRTQAKDEKVYLAPPKKRRVEELIGYMSQDEVIEVTPKHVRLRKLHCDSSAREQASRNKTRALRALKRK